MTQRYRLKPNSNVDITYEQPYFYIRVQGKQFHSRPYPNVDMRRLQQAVTALKLGNEPDKEVLTAC